MKKHATPWTTTRRLRDALLRLRILPGQHRQPSDTTTQYLKYLGAQA